MSECKYGHTAKEVADLIGPSKVSLFNEWLRGEGFHYCNADNCGNHDPVISKDELGKFIYRTSLR